MINVETAAEVLVGDARREAHQNRPKKMAQRQDFAIGISAAEIREELERIIGSADFPASARNRRVLQYIVQCALQDRREEATALNIATRVYGRPKSFNPCKDPIVRIEMTRLRRDLETYYLKSGRGNALRISIPRGGYFPEVSRPVSGEVSPAAAQASPFLVSVLRVSLNAWSGAHDAAAAAWQDLLLSDPNLPANLQEAVLREVGDEDLARLIVEGVLRAARPTT